MQKWNLVIDIAACTNCNNCVVATQEEYAGNAFPGYSAPGAPDAKTLDIDRHVRGQGSMVDVHYVPRMCNHCDNAPCVKAGGGAVVKRADGIVIVDPERAKGRRDLVDACPYGAIKWNEAEQAPQNWIFDAHLIDTGWQEPRAAHVCPTRAMRALKVDDRAMAAIVKDEGLTVLQPDWHCAPRVYYRNMEPVLTHFIGGNVSAGGSNVEGAQMALLRDGAEIATTATDIFGDFRFDGIAAGSAGYALCSSHETLGVAEVALEGVIDSSRVVELHLD